MSSPKIEILQKDPPPLTNSIQMLRSSSEGDGDGENSKASPTTLAKKIVASECFGLSRVRCAGWLVI